MGGHSRDLVTCLKLQVRKPAGAPTLVILYSSSRLKLGSSSCSCEPVISSANVDPLLRGFNLDFASPPSWGLG